MTLARIGNQTINLGLVVKYQDVVGPENRIELILLTGATIALEGIAADAMRRYIAANAVDLLAAEAEPAAGQFSAGPEGHLLPHADRAEQRG